MNNKLTRFLIATTTVCMKLKNKINYCIFQITMPKKGEQVSKADKKLKRKEWEDAMEAVIRDITQGAKSKQTPLVQIVIYETSV